MSDKSYRRVARFGRPLFRWMLGNIDRLLVQSAADADRFRSLLPAADAGRVEVLGNSKFDQDIRQLSQNEVAELRASLHMPVTAPVFVAGSTRSVEEEEQVLTAYTRLRDSYPDLCLVVAPRQIDRGADVAAALERAGLQPVRRSLLTTASGEVRHLVLDTMGELANVYAVATITFVGNSFEPVVKGGGQNLLQPLAHGKPVFFGPRIATIRSEAALAKECGAGFQVADGAELAILAGDLLKDPARLDKISNAAQQLIAANRGVSARYADAVAAACGALPPESAVTGIA